MNKGFAQDAIALLGGFVLWSVGFAALYGAHGMGCAPGWPGWLDQRAALIVLFAAVVVAHLGFAGWLIRRTRSRRPAAGNLDRIALALAVAALGATLWSGLPVLLLDLC